jgi:hypothetical protein
MLFSVESSLFPLLAFVKFSLEQTLQNQQITHSTRIYRSCLVSNLIHT